MIPRCKKLKTTLDFFKNKDMLDYLDEHGQPMPCYDVRSKLLSSGIDLCRLDNSTLHDYVVQLVEI